MDTDKSLEILPCGWGGAGAYLEEKYFERSIAGEKIINCFSVEDIVIKSILSALEKLKSAFREQASSAYSCYKLLGYDVLLDQNLNPHLIGESSVFQWKNET